MPGLVLAPRRVGEATAEHAIDPALEDRGHGEPPHRKLEQHEVGRLDLVLFGLHVGAVPVGGEGVLLLAREIEVVGVRALSLEIAGAERGVPAHAIQVADHNGVPHPFEFANGDVLECTVERCRLGVCKDDQDVHVPIVQTGDTCC